MPKTVFLLMYSHATPSHAKGHEGRWPGFVVIAVISAAKSRVASATSSCRSTKELYNAIAHRPDTKCTEGSYKTLVEALTKQSQQRATCMRLTREENSVRVIAMPRLVLCACLQDTSVCAVCAVRADAMIETSVRLDDCMSVRVRGFDVCRLMKTT